MIRIKVCGIDVLAEVKSLQFPECRCGYIFIVAIAMAVIDYFVNYMHALYSSYRY